MQGEGREKGRKGGVSLYQALAIKLCLTDEGEEDGVVIGHDKESDVGETAAGLEVPKGMHQPLLLPTALNKHL